MLRRRSVRAGQCVRVGHLRIDGDLRRERRSLLRGRLPLPREPALRRGGVCALRRRGAGLLRRGDGVLSGALVRRGALPRGDVTAARVRGADQRATQTLLEHRCDELQVRPHAPQWLALLRRSTSQPLLALPSQFP